MRYALVLSALVLPEVASAIELDFYTYNGFEETVSAFKRLALIISDEGFLVFVLVFTAIGVTFAALKAGYDGFMGGQINPSALFLPTILGVAVFKGLVLSTGTMHVYDPVRNAYEPIADVPDLVVILAGTLSKIERGMVEITNTASASPYADTAGGIGFSMIKAAMDTDVNDRYLTKSIIEYYHYCGTRALGQSTSGGWGQNLMHNSEDLYTDFANWTNGVLSVVYYPPGNDQGEVRSCTAAWAGLSARLTTASTYDAYIDSICRTVGMNPADPAQRTRCQSLIAQSAAMFDVATPAMIPYLRSVILAKGVSEASNSADFSRGQRALVDRQVMAEAFGVSEAMNSWVPRVRAYMTATVLGLIPMAFLFLVTPLFKNTIALVLGLFAWLALWGTCDAVAVQMALDQAQDAFEQIRSQRLGVEAILQSPEAAVQGLGVFGKSRLVALTLATALSAALFKFGGYAFAQLGQQWQGHLEQAGEAAGRQTMHPDAQAQLQRALMGAGAPQAALASYGFSNASYGAAQTDMQSAAGGSSYVAASVTGGTSMSGAVSTEADRKTAGILSENLAATKFADGDASQVLSTETRLGTADADRRKGESAQALVLDSGQFGSTFQAGTFNAAGHGIGRQATYDKLDAQTGSADITSDGIRDVSRVDNASALAAQHYLGPSAALENQERQLAFTVSQFRGMGTLQDVSDAGTGAGRQQTVASDATNLMWRTVGRNEMADSNFAAMASGIATERNIQSAGRAIGIDTSTPEGIFDFLREQHPGVSAYVGADRAADFLRNHTNASEDQIAVVEASGTGIMVQAYHDPNNPDAGIQVGNLNAATTLQAGQSFTEQIGGSYIRGVSRSLQDGALSIADPMSLTTSSAIDTYKELFQFSDAHPAGHLDDQTRIVLGNAWARVVEGRGISSNAQDQENLSAQVGLDARAGTGGGWPRPSAGSRSVVSASSMSSSAAVGGGASVQHVETGAVGENIVVSAMTREVGEAFASAQKSAIKMFGEESEWTPIQTERAQEVIASTFHAEMLNRESGFTFEAKQETKGPAFWQVEDLDREETDARVIRKVREAASDVLR
ncbi:MAG TPA: conjugal transfer protein TraG N-terminal domain-containing protein [Vicinamibacterales bacterium]|nr:conjugal transfer protein TraG N-terminal domain-containing protein [Vicinamibacterales bacterium]